MGFVNAVALLLHQRALTGLDPEAATRLRAAYPRAPGPHFAPGRVVLSGKPDYLRHLPRVWRMFERALQHEALSPLRAWVDRTLPPELRRIGATP